MEKDIKKILSFLRKERILMYKIIESEEKGDRCFFYYGTYLYNDIATYSDNLINELLNKYSFEEIYDYILEKFTIKDD